MDNCNGFTKTTNVYAPIVADDNVTESKRYFTNSYASVIGMMFYLESNTITYIYFAVNQCARFTHNTKESHEMAMKMICRYIQVPKYKGMVFNPYNKMVVDRYADADFAGIWGHENPQDPIYDRSRTGFVVNFTNYTLLWVLKIQTDIYISTLHSEYVSFSQSFRDLLPW